jgi:2'-5' RNA ligase
MSEFMQKYAIIQLFEPMAIGAQFTVGDWPLHSTIADVFAIDWDAKTIRRKIEAQLGGHVRADSTAQGDRFFGDGGQTRVTLLEKTDTLVALHNDVIALLEQGGWRPNNPEFAKAGFLPHSTVQRHCRLHAGDRVVFDALSIVDFFPDSDPYQRKLLATIKLQG